MPSIFPTNSPSMVPSSLPSFLPVDDHDDDSGILSIAFNIKVIKLFSLLVSGVFGLVVEVVVWKFRKLENDESLLVDMKWYVTCLDYSVSFTSLALQMTAAVQYLDNGDGWNGLLMIACQVLSSVLSMLHDEFGSILESG